MPNKFIAKLENFTQLSGSDHEALHDVVEKRYCASPHIDIAVEGQITGNIKLILSGWACRYRQVPDGRRQITSIFLPGDICYLQSSLIGKMDHSIGTLTSVEYADICSEKFSALLGRHPRIKKALAWEMEVSASISREWLVNIGQRGGPQRVGHLLCELFERLGSVGLTDGNRCEMPLRQIDLASVTGLTSIHINRCLQELRRKGLIALQNRLLSIEDQQSLWRDSSFNPRYLHLSEAGAYLDPKNDTCLPI